MWINGVHCHLVDVSRIPESILAPGSYDFLVSATFAPDDGSFLSVTSSFGFISVTVNGPNYAAQLLNVDFGATLNSVDTGFAVTGESFSDIWNILNPRNGHVASSPLRGADGTPSSVNVIITNTVEAAVNGATDKMYNSYLVCTGSGSQTMTVLVTNLPAGTNDLYIYSSNARFDLRAGTTDYGTLTCYDPTPTYIANNWSCGEYASWQEGVQFVHYSGVVSQSGQPLIITVQSTTGGLAQVSGIQIVRFANAVQAPPSCTDTPSGLVDWFRAEGNATDFMGNALNATPYGISYQAGMVGQAFSFNGSGSCVMDNNDPPLTNIQDNFTMEFWAYPEGGIQLIPQGNDTGSPGEAGQRYAIFPNYGGDEAAGAGVSVGTNGICVIENGNGYMPSMLTYPMAINGWVHVAVVYTNKQPTLYVNGIAAQTGVASGRSFVYPSRDLGGNIIAPWSSYGPYQGLLDEVSIYDRALGPGEILSVYQAGCAGKCTESVPQPPVIIRQPQDQTVQPGNNATFNVFTTGSTPMSYQWMLSGRQLTDGSGVSGSQTATLTLSDVAPQEAGNVTVVVANGAGRVTSAPAVLTVGAAPTIITAPSDQTISEDGNVIFTVVATGLAPLHYQWYFNGALMADGGGISGSQTAMLTLNDVQTLQAGAYSVSVANSVGNAASAPATLTVSSLDVVGPNDVTVAYGQNAVFNVQFNGGAPTHYQWRKHVGTTIEDVGADSSTYTVVDATPANSGEQYDVLVSMGNFVATSGLATLTVANALLVVSADDQTRALGTPNHSLGYTITGFVNGDNKSIVTGTTSLSTTATTGSPVGTYPITITGNLSAPNYTVIYDNGFLNVINQASASMGTDFWTVFPYAWDAPLLSLDASGPASNTGVTVTAPGYDLQNFTVNPNNVTEIGGSAGPLVPNSLTDYNVVENQGIHVTSTQPISIFGMYDESDASSAFGIYPSSMLGTYYCLVARSSDDVPPGFTDWGDRSQLTVLATATGTTTVTIIPSATANIYSETGTITGTINVTLQQGQSYQLKSTGNQDDVTGTIIQSDQPIAVFAGANMAFVPDPTFWASNPLIAEQLPVAYWTKEAFGFPLAGRANGDTYRVLAAEDNTDISINGVLVTTLNQGQFYETIINGAADFQGSKPIQVAQFSNGGFFDEQFGVEDPNDPGKPGLGDPFEMLLPPAGHYLTSYTVLTPTGFYSGFITNYLNLIVQRSDTNNVLVDGQPPNVPFRPIASSGYYGAQVGVLPGAHTVSAPSPVGLQIYGFGNYDAYGYMGGITNFAFVAVPEVTNVLLNTPTTIDVLANDIIGSRADTAVQITANPAYGTASLNNDNTIVYTPHTGFSGNDSFTYQITEGPNTSLATVTLWVNNSPPQVNDYYLNDVCMNCPTTIDVRNNPAGPPTDPDGDSISVLLVGSAQYGSLQLNADGTITYVRYPEWPWTGELAEPHPRGGPDDPDSFTYTVTDGRGGQQQPRFI